LSEDRKTAQVAAARFESREALRYVAECFRAVRGQLDDVLAARASDREWTDAAMVASSTPLGPLAGPLGQRRAGSDHVPFGPLRSNDAESFRSGAGRAPVAPLPAHLRGPHITLFGPADGVKMCANAMNAIDKRIAGEPAIVEQLVRQGIAEGVVPMWGADDEGDDCVEIHISS
jgi:hypothetical protein